MEIIKKILKGLFIVTLMASVLLGIATVLIQAVAIVTMQGWLSAWAGNTINQAAIACSGVCAVVSFLYLLCIPSKQSADDEEELDKV